MSVQAIEPATTMNRHEQRYADLLWLRQRAGEVKRYWFEPVKLRLGRSLFYTPDFMVVLADLTIEFHEVKGYWRDDARVKIVAAASQYPLFRFVAVQLVKGRWEFEEIKPHG